jgi:hypothetical protein
MGVLEPRQDPRLVTIRSRHLDRNEPPTQIELLGEIDTGKSASSQLQHDPEACQFLAGARQDSWRTRSTGVGLSQAVRFLPHRGSLSVPIDSEPVCTRTSITSR